jgi:Uncharacterized protein conserved in bacteria (DUF2252)
MPKNPKSPIETIQESTLAYEAWIAKYLTLLPADLDLKHKAMAENVFPFMRATFYRWMQRWPIICPGLAKAPQALAVGDLHVENFGTWRDTEGRLVWGINDFDEACDMAYTVDLVRLAASMHIAVREGHLSILVKDACSAILDGYRLGMERGGRPFVLAEEHRWLHDTVMTSLRDPVQYWQKFEGLVQISKAAPKSARRAIEKLLPEPGLAYKMMHRVAGLGSLGRERFLAVAEYRGARVAREAKALAPSACIFAERLPNRALHYQEILDRSVRAIDPFVCLKGSWIVRRLSPDCSRVELSSLPKQRDETKLLHSMGFETANVHLGTPKAVKPILKHLRSLPKNWLHEAAANMVADVTQDWQQWRDSVTPRGITRRGAAR